MITLGDQTFAALGGPVSVTVLEPTEAMNEALGFQQPIVLFLGDEHSSNQEMCANEPLCDMKREGMEPCLSIMSKEWYRLLDSISSKEKPIDYTVEAFFPLALLNKDPVYVVQPEKDKQLTTYDRLKTIYKDSPVMWILDHHFHCFSREQSYEADNDICFTKHIRYQFVDVRLGYDAFHVEPKDEMFAKTSAAYFEDGILENMRNGLFYYHQHTIHKDSKLSASILAILPLSLPEGPIKFAELLWNDKAFQTHSLVFKQIRKENNKEFFRSIFIQYIAETLPLAIPSKTIHELKRFINYKEHLVPKFREVVRTALHDVNKFYILHHFENYISVITSYIRNIGAVFLDLYFLFRMWKRKENLRTGVHYNPWMYVLNAGNNHCSYLTRFLTKEFYTPLVKKGFDVSENLSNENIAWVTSNTKRCVLLDDCKLNFDMHADQHSISLLRRRKAVFGKFYYPILMDTVKLSKTFLKKIVKEARKHQQIPQGITTLQGIMEYLELQM